MNITESNIVGQIVAQDYRTARIFELSGIDYCCNGNRTIEQACAKAGVDQQKLISEVNNLTSEGAAAIDYKSWPLDLLVDYIVKRHHRYVETKISEIKPLLDKIVRVHGSRHPELSEIEKLFNQSAEELRQHMKKEEIILFPYIVQMSEASQNGTKMSLSHFGTVQNPVHMMMQEHETEGERFRKIAALTNNYIWPEDGCTTYMVTFSLLKEFQDDLHLHIHLENNILFPKAIEMEQAFNQNK